jgi:hypothetical protein
MRMVNFLPNFSRSLTMRSMSSAKSIPSFTFKTLKPRSPYSCASFNVSSTFLIPMVLEVGND